MNLRKKFPTEIKDLGNFIGGRAYLTVHFSVINSNIFYVSMENESDTTNLMRLLK